MIDKTKKYKTRDGRDVRIYATDGSEPLSAHGAVLFTSGWHVAVWSDDGEHSGGLHCDLDLVPVPTLRPWTTVDAPKVAMLRPKEAHKEPRPRVWRSMGGGFACCVPYGGLASDDSLPVVNGLSS